jgi:3-methyl-2-oxobutanoate hydroxymethyltransferase
MPMCAKRILSLGATYPAPPRTCRGTMVKTPEATAVPTNVRRLMPDSMCVLLGKKVELRCRDDTKLGADRPPEFPPLAGFSASRHNVAMPNESQRITVPAFRAMKQAGKKISVLTAYDYPTARLLDEAGIEGILVGDSMSMVVQGHSTTLPVTLDEMIYHAEMVGRAVQQALVIVDMPFPTTHLGHHQAIAAAGRILKETRCQAVKLEGGAAQAEVIAALTAAGIPVMAHVGLRPQSVHQMGGYRVQRDEQQLLADARAAEQAGAFSIVLECIPAAIAAKITGTLTIPTIGIGAGPIATARCWWSTTCWA